MPEPIKETLAPQPGWRERLAQAGLHRGHGGLALGVLALAVWAYLVTHPVGGRAPAGQEHVAVWDVPASAVTALAYHAPGTDFTLEAEQQGADPPYLWVTTSIQPKPPPGPDGKPPPVSAPPQVQSFKGNAAAQKTFEQFVGLRALRDLGRLDALDAAAFGLAEPDASVELRRNGNDPLHLDLGRMTFGNSGRYAHFRGDGRVYLLSSAALRVFAGTANALLDRDLLGLQTTGAKQIVLAQDGFERTFYPMSEPGKWAAEPEGEEPVEEMGALAALLDRLKVSRYAPEADVDPGMKTPALEVRLQRGDNGAEEKLEIFLPREQKALARSSYTRRPVEVPVPILQQVLEKARSLLRRT